MFWYRQIDTIMRVSGWYVFRIVFCDYQFNVTFYIAWSENDKNILMGPSLWTIEGEQVSYFFQSYRSSTREPRTRSLFHLAKRGFVPTRSLWLGNWPLQEKRWSATNLMNKKFSVLIKVERASCFDGEPQHAQSCESKRAFFSRVRREEEKRRVCGCGGKGWQQTKKRQKRRKRWQVL